MTNKSKKNRKVSKQL